MKHHGRIAMQVRDYTTNILKKAYLDNWTKVEGENIITKISDYVGIRRYSEEPYNSKIKMTLTSGTVTLDAIWIYK